MNPLHEIEELVAFEGRGPGTDAERRAAMHLGDRLRELGRQVHVEPIRVRPNYPVVHLLHALLAIVGSVVSVSSPVVGLALVGLAFVSTVGDLTGSLTLGRFLTGARASQNVVSREEGGKPGTLVLVAHYDAARTGAVFAARALARRARIGKLIRRPIGPFEPFVYAMLVVLVCAGLRVIGIEAFALTVVQFIPTVALIVSVPLLADIALSSVVPGATDNASGVATVLRLADDFTDELEHFDLWVLLTGAEEGLLLGMRRFLRAHKKELDKRTTVFVGIDKVGGGTVRYAVKEGLVLAYRFHPSLIELCEEIAGEDGTGENRYGARRLVSRQASDAHAARAAGYPAISISCLNAMDYAPDYHQPTDTPERVDPEALERGYEFCADLIESIDERIGPRLSAAHDAAAEG